MRVGRILAVAIMLTTSSGCTAEPRQQRPNLQETSRQLRAIPGCEGCEAAWEREPSELTPRVQIAPASEPGERLILRGTVYKPDGKTPAPGVVVYIHQTNSAGLYANGSNESEWSRRHGRLRGWLKTGADGRYEVDTIKPGVYPDGREPAHIHLTVLEPGKDPYWIDDVVFAGEQGVDATYRAERENRGGRGIVALKREPSGRWLAERNIDLLR